ncbi:MAG: GIY-YIG nuclease family protein [Candidatus Spechtbacterales bacterium]
MRKSLPIEKSKELPQKPGVYFLKNKDGSIFYVGKAINIKNRIYSHKQREEIFRPEKIHSVEWIETVNEIEALLKESYYIKRLQPKMNTRLRDDKQYFYVGITKEEYPRIFITHQPIASKDSSLNAQNDSTKKPKTYRLKPITYLGPYTDGKALKATMKYLRKLFPYYATNPKRPYSTKKHGSLPCSYCHLNLCPGPAPSKEEYKKNIRAIKNVLKGRKSSVIKELKREMNAAAKTHNYEKAAEIRNIINAVDNIFSHQFVLAWAPPSGSTARCNIDEELAKVIGAKEPINSIEGYDISNIQGKEPTASMVRFDNGEPNKSLYRKFNIHSKNTPDDYIMMKEAVERRFKHDEWPFPDLVLIDGGAGQLSAALKAVRNFEFRILNFEKNLTPTTHNLQPIAVVALAKREEELYLPGRKKPIPLSEMPPDVANLLKHVRDEAHRFAVSHHRKKHGENFKK